jgi:hypothetical protein
MESEKIAISLYRNFIPPSSAEEMDRLYQHVNSSVEYLSIYGDIGSDTHTYVERKNGRETAVFLFVSEGKKVRVLNEQMRIDSKEIERFASHVFSNFSFVTSISFRAIETEIRRLPFPFQQFFCNEDFIVKLPSSANDYLTDLGKSTRNYIKRYLNKLKREFPSFSFHVYHNHEASEQCVRSVIEMNRARMAEKNITSYIDADEEERIIQLVKWSGMVSLIKINDRICAGTITYRVGKNYFLKVISHDSLYNDFRVGILCCYLTICECIARGGKEYHFLWGRYDYKYRLLGVQRNLDQLVIYRSPVQLLLNGGMALPIAFNGYGLLARRWILNRAKATDDSPVSLLLFHMVRGLKYLKQLRFHPLTTK